MWAAVLPIIAMGILALVMYTVMKFAKLNGFTNYKDTFSALYPKPWMEVFFEIFYIVILSGGSCGSSRRRRRGSCKLLRR